MIVGDLHLNPNQNQNQNHGQKLNQNLFDEIMSKASTKPPSGPEQRDFFRVSQDVIFDYKAVENFAAENGKADNEFDDATSLSLIDELRRLDRDNVQALRILSDKNRLLGDYLQALSTKIDLIARHTLFARDENDNNKATTRINLSEDGLAFLSQRAIYKGSYIAVRLIFLPSYSPVITFAKVLRCDPSKDKYNIAVKFHRLEEVYRQEISRQILRAQASQRKKKPNE